MSTGEAPRFRRHRIRRAFDRAATGFGGSDFLYREMARRMGERLEMLRIEPRQILDAGCGLGADRPLLSHRYPEAQWLGVDSSQAMLMAGRRADLAASGFFRRLLNQGRGAQSMRVGADLNALPIAPQSIDFIWSNAALHWLDDVPETFQEFNRVLRVGGLLMFSLFGPDTLKELSQATQMVASAMRIDRTQSFVDMHDVGDMLVNSSFSDPVMDMETLTLTYTDPWQALRELKKMGSSVATYFVPSGLTHKHFWDRVIAHWPRNSDGRYTLTFELVQGHAWKMAPKRHADGRAVVNFMPKPNRR
ncbi:MAG: Malonyl-[acyl-carrier protein] O-methyltransferase [Fluviibacter phosphoraccumulans EoVTN8]